MARKHPLEVKSRTLVELLGAEYSLMKQSDSASIQRFFLSSLFIVVISIITIGSVWYAMELLFHLIYVEWIMAVFISVLFLLIYIFLLNTFSKQDLGNSEPGKSQWKKKLTASNVIRTGFVGFIGFLIAQPIGVLLFQPVLENKVSDYKSSLISNHAQKLDSLYESSLMQLESDVLRYKALLAGFPDQAISERIALLESDVHTLNEKKIREQEHAAFKISESDFFLFQVRSVSRQPLCWIVWMVVVVIFLVPGYLIFSIGNEDQYYALKKQRDIMLIQKQFDWFQAAYVNVFAKQYSVTTAYFSLYLDPPFCTVLKTEEGTSDEAAFIEKYKPRPVS